jgi:SRSO17 transposase
MRDLDVWLEPFLAALGHKKRRAWAPLYLRGLLGPGERKSLQPMAASLGLSGHDQLQHFIASPAWDDEPLWRVLAEQADRLAGGSIGDRRHGAAEEGHALGRRRAAILRPAR